MPINHHLNNIECYSVSFSTQCTAPIQHKKRPLIAVANYPVAMQALLHRLDILFVVFPVLRLLV